MLKKIYKLHEWRVVQEDFLFFRIIPEDYDGKPITEETLKSWNWLHPGPFNETPEDTGETIEIITEQETGPVTVVLIVSKEKKIYITGTDGDLYSAVKDYIIEHPNISMPYEGLYLKDDWMFERWEGTIR